MNLNKNKVISIKQRVGAAVGILFLLIPLGGLSGWMGIDSISNYLSFPMSLVYSTWDISLVFYPMLLAVAVVLLIPSIFTGKNVTRSFGEKLTKLTFVILFIGFLVSMSFRFFYLNILEKKGYEECSGVPTGYMPGMGTRYVINLSLCK